MAVYFIRAGDGPVKIGTADDPKARMRELQCGNYLDLTLVRVIDGNSPEERWLHRHYEPFHIRGEWFRFDESMLHLEPPLIEPETGHVTPVSRIIAECYDGKVSRLAAAMEVTYQAVRKWESNGVPAERVLQLEAASGGRVTRYDIRPDIYPRESAA